MPPQSIEAAHFSPDTREFIRLLDQHGVRYVIVGGEAVIYYGYARLTGDVDFFYDRDVANVRALFAALTEFWDGSIPETGRFWILTTPALLLAPSGWVSSPYQEPTPFRSQITQYLSANKPDTNVLLAPWWAGVSVDFWLELLPVEQVVSNYAMNLLSKSWMASCCCRSTY